MEPWLESDKSYERRRVVQSLFLLLQYVADYVKFTVSLLTAHGAVGAGEGRGGSPATLCPVAASDARSQNSLSTEPLETRHRPCPGSPQPRGEGHDSDRAVWGDRHGDAACERDLEAGRSGTGWPGGSIRRRPRRERPAHRGPGAASAVFGRNRGGPLLLGWVGSSRGLDYAVLE